MQNVRQDITEKIAVFCSPRYKRHIAVRHDIAEQNCCSSRYNWKKNCCSPRYYGSIAICHEIAEQIVIRTDIAEQIAVRHDIIEILFFDTI
jgi:hypothetical protein